MINGFEIVPKQFDFRIDLHYFNPGAPRPGDFQYVVFFLSVMDSWVNSHVSQEWVGKIPSLQYLFILDFFFLIEFFDLKCKIFRIFFSVFIGSSYIFILYFFT